MSLNSLRVLALAPMLSRSLEEWDRSTLLRLEEQYRTRWCLPAPIMEHWKTYESHYSDYRRWAVV
jgi:hypothetical protein